VQWQRLFQQMHGLGTAEAIVKMPNRKDAFGLKVAWLDPEWKGTAKWEAAELAKKRIVGQHPYNFVPRGACGTPEQAAELRSDGSKCDDGLDQKNNPID